MNVCAIKQSIVDCFPIHNIGQGISALDSAGPFHRHVHVMVKGLAHRVYLCLSELGLDQNTDIVSGMEALYMSGRLNNVFHREMEEHSNNGQISELLWRRGWGQRLHQ